MQKANNFSQWVITNKIIKSHQFLLLGLNWDRKIYFGDRHLLSNKETIEIQIQ